MSLGEVKKLLFPFRPVRVHVSDGQSYRIEHPEFFILFSLLTYLTLGRAACLSGLLLAGLLFPLSLPAWDYEGHRLINELALAALPGNFPAFALTPAARERIAFLAGEADRWRNTPDLALKHCNGPDHYMDIDELPSYELEPASLPPFRYDLVAQLALARAAHPAQFAPIDPAKDADHTRALVGFLPWRMTEDYAKLKSAFSYLKALEQRGTAEEITNAQQNVIYLMGLMGHFVGDAAQPLHTTKHHHGWVGKNPFGYTTNYTFHAWIDGGYLRKLALTPDALRQKVRPAGLLFSDEKSLQTNVFTMLMTYVIEQQRLVEPLYQLDKAGKLSGRGEVSTEGYNFITGQMVKGAQMLGDLWLSAWQGAPTDKYLMEQLAKRNAAVPGSP